MEDTRATPLKKILLERLREKGPLTFAAYMTACLYEPGYGYYTSPGRKVGAEGDFYTSSNVHDVFGRLLAREVSRMWESMGRNAAFNIVEVGAGNGRLAADILDALKESHPDFYTRVTYRFIEKEASLKDAQRQMLGHHAARIDWSTPEELSSGRLSFTGCLLSNELIDAFPVHVIEMTSEGLKEVHVVEKEGEFSEVLAPPSTDELAAYLDRTGAKLAVGQRAEVNLAAVDWLTSVAHALQRGFVLTIDYGYLAEELYSPFRMNGTLLCYYRHTIEEDPYLRPGLQDMTSHVNFSALIETGRLLGLEPVWFGEQYRFLLAAGIMKELVRLEAAATAENEKIKNRLALKKLMLPEGGMGDTFKVLVQAKGVSEPGLLCREDWQAAL